MGYEKLKEVTVLYVEDEDMMRESVVMLLKRQFKQVFVAANGLEAVNIYNLDFSPLKSGSKWLNNLY